MNICFFYLLIFGCSILVLKSYGRKLHYGNSFVDYEFKSSDDSSKLEKMKASIYPKVKKFQTKSKNLFRTNTAEPQRVQSNVVYDEKDIHSQTHDLEDHTENAVSTEIGKHLVKITSVQSKSSDTKQLQKNRQDFRLNPKFDHIIEIMPIDENENFEENSEADEQSGNEIDAGTTKTQNVLGSNAKSVERDGEDDPIITSKLVSNNLELKQLESGGFEISAVPKYKHTIEIPSRKKNGVKSEYESNESIKTENVDSGESIKTKIIVNENEQDNSEKIDTNDELANVENESDDDESANDENQSDDEKSTEVESESDDTKSTDVESESDDVESTDVEIESDDVESTDVEIESHDVESTDVESESDVESTDVETESDDVESTDVESESHDVESTDVESESDDVESTDVESESDDVESTDVESESDDVESTDVESESDDVESTDVESESDDVESTDVESESDDVESTDLESESEDVESTDGESESDDVESTDGESESDDISANKESEFDESANGVSARDADESVNSENTDESVKGVNAFQANESIKTENELDITERIIPEHIFDELPTTGNDFELSGNQHLFDAEFEGSGEDSFRSEDDDNKVAGKSGRFVFSRQNGSAPNCTTPKGEAGQCKRIRECLLSETLSNFNVFLQHLCLIRGALVGVCCPNNPVIEISNEENVTGNATESEILQPPEGCGLNTKTRIVGGTISVPHEWTWMVALLRRNRFYCGGVIINNLYVLTAAHCVMGMNVKELSVRLGEYDFNTHNKHQEDISVAEIKRHAQFVTLTFQHDIALLKLRRTIQYSKFVGSICLPSLKARDYSDVNGTVVGWGTVSFGGAASPILRQVTIPIWKNEDCDRAYRLENINESFMCAGSPEKGEDACQGDSGGPLMSLNDKGRWEVIGIVSWGRRCGDPSYPGVYTRVTTYLDWIAQNAI